MGWASFHNKNKNAAKYWRFETIMSFKDTLKIKYLQYIFYICESLFDVIKLLPLLRGFYNLNRMRFDVEKGKFCCVLFLHFFILSFFLFNFTGLTINYYVWWNKYWIIFSYISCECVFLLSLYFVFLYLYGWHADQLNSIVSWMIYIVFLSFHLSHSYIWDKWQL